MNNARRINRCSLLLAHGFINDPLIKYQIQRVSDPLGTLYWFFRSQLEAYDELNAVDYLDGDKGCFAYYNTSELSEIAVLKALRSKSSVLIDHLHEDDLVELSRRTSELTKVCRSGWYRDYWNDPVCSTEFVTIDSRLKGSGAFKRLFVSVKERYMACNIPVVGQTTNPDNVPLYKHCGFEVVDVRAADSLPFACYYVAAIP